MLKYLSVFFLLLVLFCSCEKVSTEEKTQDKKLKILSTTGMINELVNGIGKAHVETSVLIQGDLDPHTYQLVKGDDEKFLSSDLIFYNGLGLEHGTGLLLHLKEGNKGHSLGDFLLTFFPDDVLYLDGHADPHIWMDLKLFSQTVPFIVERLSQKDPEHALEYQQNGKELQKELLQAHQKIQELLFRLPQEKRYLVTSHDAFQYFTRAYLAEPTELVGQTWRKRCQAPEGLSPENQIGLKDIKRIVDHLKTHKVCVLFPESNLNKDSIRKILFAGKEAGLQIKIATSCLFADAMGPPGSPGDSYIKMLLHNAEEIYQNLNE